MNFSKSTLTDIISVIFISVVAKKESKGRRNLEIKAKCQYENNQIPKRV
jgi:hypothetical protein